MIIENRGTRLRITDTDGFSHDFHAFWLREASSNPEYRDPGTGHKLKDADQLPLDVNIAEITQRGEMMELRFSDGHVSSYSLTALRKHAEHPCVQELVGEKRLWDATLDPLPWHELDTIAADPRQLLALLNDVARLGFALVRGVPPQHEGLAHFIALLGHMRITNNGGIEDIKAIGTGRVYDLSMTPRALEPHVDNPYRLPQPGYVLLHCLQNDAEGGESGLTDGLAVAAKLRKEHPDLFKALCTTPVTFRYADDQAILEHTSPFVDVGVDGAVRHVRFHGRCDQVIAADPATLDTFYRARRLYSQLIRSDEMQLRFKLAPSEMFIVDNFRIIHSRRAFRLETGARHMQQAYVDRDVVSSRQKTLLRDINAKPWRPRVALGDAARTAAGM